MQSGQGRKGVFAKENRGEQDEGAHRGHGALASRTGKKVKQSIYILFELRIIWEDVRHWNVILYTPIFGIGIRKNAPSIDRYGRESSIWIGLVPRIPADDTFKIYFVNWKREFSFVPFEHGEPF